MSTREIPLAEWSDFADSFSRTHAGWLVTLEVLGIDLGAQLEARELPLGGVSFDHPENTIWITLGRSPTDHLAHGIRDVTHVRLQETDEGAHQALQVESKDGTTTLVRFRTAVQPEQVDGVLPG